jgi:hypothetical protein
MRATLVELVNKTNPRGLPAALKANTQLCEWVMMQTNNLPENAKLSERIWVCINQDTILCANGNRPVFKDLQSGYRQFCGVGKACPCRQKSHSEKIKTGWSQLDADSRKKRTEKSLETLNSSEVQARAIATNLEKYGVEKPFSNVDVRGKAFQSYKSSTGFDTPLHNPNVQKQAQETQINRYGGLMISARNSLGKKYGGRNPFTVSEIQQKSKDTMLDKYGVEYASQNIEIRDRIKSTNIEKYGCENPMQISYSTELKQCLLSNTVAEKYSEYGFQWFIDNGASESITRKWLISNNAISPRQSTQEETVESILKNYAVNYEKNTRKIIPPKELDFYLPDHNVAFEMNGLYWHSEVAGGKDKRYHLTKTVSCQEKGIKLIHINEHSMLYSPLIIESMILNSIGKSNKLHARKAEIRELDSREEKQFFQTTHLQGYTPSRVCFGLILNGEVVAAMSFAKPRFNKNFEWELLRFSSKLNHVVVGGASKLFTFFIRLHNPNSVISYCDYSRSHGNLYKQLGFFHSHISKPNYFYTIDYTTLESRQKYQKHKLDTKLNKFDPSLTEWENMKNNNYDRIWDCGNIVMTWTNQA